MNLVRRLMDDIVDDRRSASSVLRRAKILASQLGEHSLSTWLDAELNGFEEDSRIPTYRRVKLPLLGSFSGSFGSSMTGYSVPLTLLPDGVRRLATETPLSHPLRELESYAASGNDGLRLTLPTEAVLISRDHLRMSGGMVLIELYQPISLGILEGVVDSVRTRFLDFLLALQELDAEVLESEEALRSLSKKAVHDSFSITVYGDNNVIAPHSAFGSISIQSVEAHDLTSLKSFARELGLSTSDANDLAAALEADGQPERGQLGSAAAKWIGRMTSKAATGAWKMALSTAPRVLQEAIFRYYGWS